MKKYVVKAYGDYGTCYLSEFGTEWFLAKAEAKLAELRGEK
jgi:hypothetical protein